MAEKKIRKAAGLRQGARACWSVAFMVEKLRGAQPLHEVLILARSRLVNP